MNPVRVPESAGPNRGQTAVNRGQGEVRIAAIISSANRLGAKTVSKSLRSCFGKSVDLKIHVVGSSREATAVASEAAVDSDIVVAVGGDGTVADVATGIFATGASLGIVPAGSANMTARALGIPAHPTESISLLAGPHALRSIDVGRGGGRSFLHIAGAGFDAELFKTTNPVWKRRLGWVAYLPAAAAALRIKPSSVRLTMDGEPIEARSPLVLVANGGSAIAPGFRIYPGIAVDDGWLDVLVFTSSTPAQIAATLGHASRQRLDLSPYVSWSRVRTVRIEATPPLAVELDGDPQGETPREFHVVPAGIQVVIPLG